MDTNVQVSNSAQIAQNRLLGVVVPAPDDINQLDFKDYFERYAKMYRALVNWRDGVNGKCSISVEDENKEWLLKLLDETNESIRHFEAVFNNA